MIKHGPAVVAFTIGVYGLGIAADSGFLGKVPEGDHQAPVPNLLSVTNSTSTAFYVQEMPDDMLSGNPTGRAPWPDLARIGRST